MRTRTMCIMYSAIILDFGVVRHPKRERRDPLSIWFYSQSMPLSTQKNKTSLYDKIIQ
ncbi:hypothetical protein BC941DRAFT_409781 [Chlamydoabsidia padenii]|nr:hypothetical protein BC941DRAFT_409781 [Chlamydoabsidia padenii]